MLRSSLPPPWLSTYVTEHAPTIRGLKPIDLGLGRFHGFRGVTEHAPTIRGLKLPDTRCRVVAQPWYVTEHAPTIRGLKRRVRLSPPR